MVPEDGLPAAGGAPALDDPVSAPPASAPGAPAAPVAPEEVAPSPAAMAPVAAGERIAAIDVVRGFALLGILLMNVEYFTRPIAGMFFGLDATLTGLDRAAGWFVMTFVQGKFYTLFSMLFGMGFAIQAERARARGARFGRLFLRRLSTLGAIGALHGYLLWSGDILLVYAIMGAVLLLFFRKTPARRLWKWALAFVLLVALAQLAVVAGMTMAPGSAERTATMVGQFRAEYADAAAAYASASWTDLFPVRVREMNHQLGFLPFFGWSVLGMFLLGAWLVRSGVMADPGAHRALFRRFLIGGIGIGAPLAILAMAFGAGRGMTDISIATGLAAVAMLAASFALCFGYLGGFVLLALSPAWKPRLAPVGAAGRMALTNYLLQSVVATTLFYGYGLGLYGKVPRAAQLGLALAIWAGNVALSAWWLRRFRFGPAEWLWRSLTYAHRQPMRRAESPALAAEV